MLLRLAMDNIEKNKLIVEEDNVVVGVSGGYDSVALLDVLCKLSKEKKFNVFIAHVNHGVRGEESDGDEAYVKALSLKYGVPFYSKRVDMLGYAKEKKMSSEEAGRELRYGFFNSILEALGGGKIAVAHNKNDQAETVLMRIMRGTGIDGLKGMDYANGKIIRPILNVSRKDIEEYCAYENLNPKTDSTNFETIYDRNKVRLELIPYIEQNFNKNLIETLFRFSNQVKIDADYLNGLAEAEFEGVLLSESSNRIVVDNKKFKDMDIAIKARILRKSIYKLCGNLTGLEERHVNLIVKFSDSGKTGKSIDISKSLKIKVNYDKLYIEKSENREELGYNYKITLNKSLHIDELNSILEAKVIDIDDFILDKEDKYTEYFDLETISNSVVIRSRRDGDKIKLSGMKGSKKIKDYFMDEKIPKEERISIPLLEIDGEIAWIIGYRRGSKSKITSATKKVLVLKYVQL